MVPNPVVLLVDDEPDTVRLVRKILQADGCQILEASDGEHALDLYHQAQPDLILLDIILPRRDGLEILREIREHDANTGIIMVSALTSERMTIDAMLAGADDYISKPFPLREMRVRIRQVLDKTALRRQNAQLQAQLDRANARIRELVERFMPAQVRNEFLERAEPPSLGGKRQEITIVYADIQGFMSLAESLPPDQLVEVLNHYLQLAATAIEAKGGTVDKFMGDGVIGLFNAPASLPEHALRGVQTAQEIIETFLHAAPKEHHLSVGVGVNTGEVVVGNFGTPQLMNYTAIGDAMNLAQRLEEMAGPNEIIIGPHTYASAGAHLVVDSVGLTHIRGRNEPLNLYRVKAVRAVEDANSLLQP
jgi:adenylate cyclase